MRLTIEDYILATIAYADIFHYPLTEDDAYYWCIKKNPQKNFRARSIHGIEKHKYFLVLKGRKAIIRTYEERHAESRKKWNIARAIGFKLQHIPSILLVGVTGGVAVKNASKNDDIDFFFITAKGTMWITRLLIILALDMMGKRRKWGQIDVKDTICINMFMSEDALALSKSERDLFSAHEVLQMEPLWSRRDTYKRFLQANLWVKHFLPIAWGIKQAGRNQHPKISHWYTRIGRAFLRLFESPAKWYQLWHMSNRRTREIISDGVLQFHPKDARVYIRAAFAKRLAKYNIPIDNIFYDR